MGGTAETEAYYLKNLSPIPEGEEEGLAFTREYLVPVIGEREYSFRESLLHLPDIEPPPKRRGRPSTYRFETGIRFCCEWFGTCSYQEACRRVRVTGSTVWRWRKKYPGFRLRVWFTKEVIRVRRRLNPFYAPCTGRAFSQSRKRTFLAPYDTPLRGRPSRYPEVGGKEVGITWSDTARKLGVCRRTIGYWSRRHPEFHYKLVLAMVQNRLPRIQEKVTRLMDRYYLAIKNHLKEE